MASHNEQQSSIKAWLGFFRLGFFKVRLGYFRFGQDFRLFLMWIQHSCLTWVCDISWASHNEQPSEQTHDRSGLLRTYEPTSCSGTGFDSGSGFVRRKVSNVRGWPSIATGCHLRFRQRLGFRLGWSWFHTTDLQSKKSELIIFLLIILIFNCKWNWGYKSNQLLICWTLVPPSKDLWLKQAHLACPNIHSWNELDLRF